MRRLALPLVTVLLAGCGTDLAGPSSAFLACVFSEARALGIGEVVTFDGTGNRSLCFTTSEPDAAFVYVPFFARPAPPATEPAVPLSLDVLAAGVVPAGAAGGYASTGEGHAPDQPGADSPLRLGGDVHRRLRDREVAELEPKIRFSSAGHAPAAPPVPASEPTVGDLVELNVALSCSAQRMRTGRVMRVTERAIVVADIANPAGGFSAGDYAHFAMSFDTLIHPVATRHFGTPSDIDGNGRVIIFFTAAVNELTPGGSSSFTAAVFWSGDLFPVTATARLDACPAGNQAEVFYVAVPDPMGTVGPRVTLLWMTDRAIQVMGHEYQHLLNAARRLHVNEAPVFERTWLNEGLSHIAEELLFYEAAGLGPGANLTLAGIRATPGAESAFDRLMDANEHNLRRYLEQPEAGSPMGTDNFATRGAAWSFLRYAADRSGAGDEQLFFRLVNSHAAGLDNLDAELGGRALDWMQDWAVALHADDLVTGIDARYTQPSWNFREIYATRGGTYPLAPMGLDAGLSRRLTLQPGGAAHLGFGIAPQGRAAIHLEADGAAPPRALRGSVIRVR